VLHKEDSDLVVRFLQVHCYVTTNKLFGLV